MQSTWQSLDAYPHHPFSLVSATFPKPDLEMQHHIAQQLRDIEPFCLGLHFSSAVYYLWDQKLVGPVYGLLSSLVS